MLSLISYCSVSLTSGHKRMLALPPKHNLNLSVPLHPVQVLPPLAWMPAPSPSLFVSIPSTWTLEFLKM